MNNGAVMPTPNDQSAAFAREAERYDELAEAATGDTRIIAGIMADLAREKAAEIEERTWRAN